MIVGGNRKYNNIDPELFDEMIEEFRKIAMKYNAEIYTARQTRPMSRRYRNTEFDRADFIFIDYI